MGFLHHQTVQVEELLLFHCFAMLVVMSFESEVACRHMAGLDKVTESAGRIAGVTSCPSRKATRRDRRSSSLMGRIARPMTGMRNSFKI